MSRSMNESDCLFSTQDTQLPGDVRQWKTGEYRGMDGSGVGSDMVTDGSNTPDRYPRYFYKRYHIRFISLASHI